MYITRSAEPQTPPRKLTSVFEKAQSGSRLRSRLPLLFFPLLMLKIMATTFDPVQCNVREREKVKNISLNESVGVTCIRCDSAFSA